VVLPPEPTPEPTPTCEEGEELDPDTNTCVPLVISPEPTPEPTPTC